MHKRIMILVIAFLVFMWSESIAQTQPSAPSAPAAKIWTILPIGDSITEGSSRFISYRYPLWEKLHAAGYYTEFVGSRLAETRIGPVKHDGFGGKNAEFLAAHIDSIYRNNQADIVLLHAGHNHDVSENPIPGILHAHEQIIRTILSINPKAKVLVAQVIPSGKLPKYSYLPELNRSLVTLVNKIDPAHQSVWIVDQAKGFDPATDTVEDHVHPNVTGAEKIAQHWFDVLTPILPSPGRLLQPEILPYKTVSGRNLTLHIFHPVPLNGTKPGVNTSAAIVYFFGDGWQFGTPIQFYSECREWAKRGLVAIAVDYRINWLDKSSPLDSVADSKSAIRWIRSNAKMLRIDPNRIVAAGSSSGGQLAAATAICPGFDQPGEDTTISCRPNALLLLSPIIDSGPGGYGYDRVGKEYTNFSPFYALSQQAPPTLMFFGKNDPFTSVEAATKFRDHMKQLGGQCTLEIMEGFGHVLYSYRQPNVSVEATIDQKSLEFLKSLGYVS